MPRELTRLLLHPLILLAIAVWALNDHCLKAAFHNAFTGKLSDVSSLIAAPVLLAALTATLGIEPRRTFGLVAFWSLALASVMVAIKLWQPAAESYRYGLAAMQWPFRCLLSLELRPLRPVALTMDPGDVWTVPAVLVPLWLAARPASDKPLHACPRAAPAQVRSGQEPLVPVNRYS